MLDFKDYENAYQSPLHLLILYIIYTHIHCPTNVYIVDNSSLCLEAGLTYRVNTSGHTTLAFIPTFDKLLRSADGQSCLHQTLTGQLSRSFICTRLEYSVMAALYGSALGKLI